MGVSRDGRARRIEPVAGIVLWGGRGPDYVTSFAADVADADAESAEHWARRILEGAPLPLRLFVLTGWRLVLRLRLAPRRAAGTVAGWTISQATPDLVTLEVDSSLVHARKVLNLESSRLILTTQVWYARTRGRVLWSALAPVHHRIEPLIVSLAVSRRRRDQPQS